MPGGGEGLNEETQRPSDTEWKKDKGIKLA